MSLCRENAHQKSYWNNVASMVELVLQSVCATGKLEILKNSVHVELLLDIVVITLLCNTSQVHAPIVACFSLLLLLLALLSMKSGSTSKGNQASERGLTSTAIVKVDPSSSWFLQ
jgi:hypothetical protein